MTIGSIYERYLGRQADPVGLQGCERVNSALAIEHAILDSAEFNKITS